MMKWLVFFYCWFVYLFTFPLPDAPFIMRFRGWMYSFLMEKCGRNFQVSSTVKILGLNKFAVGDDVYLANNVVIIARALVELEDEVLVGVGSTIVSSVHTMCNSSYRFGVPKSEDIVVRKGTWLAANVVVGAGADIPCASVIGANSFVNEKLCLTGKYAGSPVKLLGKTLTEHKGS